MDFGQALKILKDGGRVRREFWANGMWLVLVPGSQFEITADRPLGKAAPHLIGDTAHYRPHLDVCMFDDGVPTLGPWLGVVHDVLAEDWSAMPDMRRGGYIDGPVDAVVHAGERVLSASEITDGAD